MWIWVWGSLNGLHSVIWLLSCNLMDYMRWIEGVSAQFLDTCMKQLPLLSHLCGGVCRIFLLVSVFLCQKQLLRIILNSDNNKRKRKKKRNSCFQWSVMGWKRGSSLGYFPSLQKVHRFCCISLSLSSEEYISKCMGVGRGRCRAVAGAVPSGHSVPRTGHCCGWLVTVERWTVTHVTAFHALIHSYASVGFRVPCF